MVRGANPLETHTALWAGVGRDGRVMYSSDAINWTEYQSPSGETTDYWDISFGEDDDGDDRWVISTNQSPEIRYSADPTAGDGSWSTVNIPGIPGGDVRTVEYGSEGTWIAGGGEDNVMRSTDGGDSWTEITGLPAGTTTMLCLATDGNGVWLAAGTGTKILKSYDDGLNWYVSGTSFDQINGLEYNNGVWFAASNTATSYRATSIAQSDTTDTWSAVSGISEALWAICHITGDTWMTANKGNQPYLSTDNCASWSTTTSPSAGQIMGLASDGTTIVCGGKDNKVHTSTDNGDSWTLRHTSAQDVLVIEYNKVKPF
tara:strand:+ start:162 stop:1109 length:948 start_codon:yes stop_codon:yes gene_type:complete